MNPITLLSGGLLRGEVVLTACVLHDDSVWVGTISGRVFRCSGNALVPVDGGRIPGVQVYSLFQDSRTNLWAGTSGGLFRWESGGFQRIQGPVPLNGNVTVVYEDRSGVLWFGTFAGLVSLHNGKFDVYPLKDVEIRAIAEDRAGGLWIGTIRGGIYTMSQEIPRRLCRLEHCPVNDARSLYFDLDGNLWIGSWGDGLFLRKAGSFRNFTTRDGLPSDKIQAIIRDSRGKFWISSNNGIFGIAPQAMNEFVPGRSPPLLCQHLSLREGMGNRFCTGAGQPVICRTSDGRMWIPNMEQMAVFGPESVGGSGKGLNVLVDSVRVDGVEVPADAEGACTISSGNRRIEFGFTALDLASPQSLRFRTLLEGMDARWVEAGGQRTARYSQLLPGEYRFRVMAGGADGQWHESVQRIRVRVVPRVWERRWVQFLGVALLMGFAGAGLVLRQRRRYRLKLHRLELEQRVEEERRRIAFDLHDEIGSRLTAVANCGELALREGQTTRDMKNQIGMITRRIRELIDVMGEIVWTVNPRNDSVSNLVAYMADYAEQFIVPAGITCRLDLDPDYPDVLVRAQARHQLLLAVKEVLNNAVKHAAPARIRLAVHYRPGRLSVEISDDGRGFAPRDQRVGGHGLQSIQDRMEAIGGWVEIKSEAGRGTSVMLLLPLNEEGAA